MCAIEDCEPWKVSRDGWRTARKAWRCCECRRAIAPGVRYRFLTGLTESGDWQTYRTCAHCEAAGQWLMVVCGGYPFTMLFDELREHWDEGFRHLAFARLIAGVRRQWHDGRDPVPEGVAELADRMMREQVA